MSVLRSMPLRLHVHELTLAATINYSSQLSVDPVMVRETIAGIGKGIGYEIAGVTEGLSHLATTIVSPITTLFSNVATFAMIIGLVGIGVYVCWQKWKGKRNRRRQRIEEKEFSASLSEKAKQAKRNWSSILRRRQDGSSAPKRGKPFTSKHVTEEMLQTTVF